MTTIEATVDPARAVVRVEVDWSETPAVRYAAVRRVVAGVVTPVRLSYHTGHPAGPWALLSAGRAVFFDTEAPLDVPVTYRTDSPDSAAAATTGPVTVGSGGVCWLSDPLRPVNTVRIGLRPATAAGCATAGSGVFFLGLGEETYAADGASFDRVATARPAVAANVRKAATSALTVLTATLADRDRVMTLAAAGTPLLFQAPPVYGWAPAYLAVGDARVGRISADHRLSWRRIALPFAVVDAPVGFGQGVPGSRWVDVCGRFGTWAELSASGLTGLDVLRGEAS